MNTIWLAALSDGDHVDCRIMLVVMPVADAKFDWLIASNYKCRVLRWHKNTCYILVKIASAYFK